MRAGFGVEAIFGDAEPLDGTATDEMFGDDLTSIFGLNVAVPYSIGINNHGGTVLALVEAERLVDADATGKACFPGELLQARVQFALSIARAGRTRSLRRTDIVANEDVAFEPGQADPPWGKLAWRKLEFRVKP